MLTNVNFCCKMKKTCEMYIMEKAKNDIIADLYALRSGLSIVSQNADEVKKCEREVDDIEIQKNKAKEDRDLMQSHLEGSKRHIKNEYGDRDLWYYKKQYQEQIKNNADRINPVKSTLVFAAIGVPLIIASFVGVAGTIGAYVRLGAIIGLVFAVLLIPIVYFILKKKVKSEEQEAVSVMQKVDEETINSLQREVSDYEMALSALNSELLSCQNKADKVKSKNEPIISKNIAFSNTMIESLQRQYCNTLSLSDWQNLDLVIYYLDTGRADTVKEALQLVDRQIQTDSIVDAIESASERIASGIGLGFQALGKLMITCFNSLSNQINSIGMQLENQHIEAMGALGRIEGRTDELITATKLAAALQAKANISSRALKQDMDYMQSRLTSLQRSISAK